MSVPIIYDYLSDHYAIPYSRAHCRDYLRDGFNRMCVAVNNLECRRNISYSVDHEVTISAHCDVITLFAYNTFGMNFRGRYSWTYSPTSLIL